MGISTQEASKKLLGFGTKLQIGLSAISLGLTAWKGIREYNKTGNVSNETIGEGTITIGLAVLGVAIGGPVVFAIALAWGLTSLFASDFIKKVNKVVGAAVRGIGNELKKFGNWLLGSNKPQTQPSF